MAKKVKGKNKKNYSHLQVLPPKTEEQEVAVVEERTLPNFKTQEYLDMKKNFEETLNQEKEELKRLKEEERIRKETEEENVRKAKELIEKRKNEQNAEKMASIEEEIPEVMKEISLFDNYSDLRMVRRKEELAKTNKEKDDFRVNKYLQVNKLPQKPRTAKLDTPEQVATMLVSSKKEILERSGKAKAIKKAKLSKEDKKRLDILFLERCEMEAKYINMFQPKGLKVPMYEVYWSVQNTIVSLQKVYKDSKNPFKEVSEFAFCDSLVWASRYLLEMVYTEDYPLDFLKQDCLEYSIALYKTYLMRNGVVTAFDVEEGTIELMKQLASRFKYSSMVVNF